MPGPIGDPRFRAAVRELDRDEGRAGGVPLAPSTLGDWSAFALDVLAPVAERLEERVLGSSYLRADDTGMRVLDRDHPAGVKRGHIWGFVGADLVAFLYAPDWTAKHPTALLQGFTG